MSELKPCPFCNAEPIFSQDYFGRYDVRCLNMLCAIMPATRVYDKPEDAAEAWNRRADLPRRLDGTVVNMTAQQFDEIYEEAD